MARLAITDTQTGGAVRPKPVAKQWIFVGNFPETEQVAKSSFPRADALEWLGSAPLITSQKPLLLPAQAK
jgi:hypothetical protein